MSKRLFHLISFIITSSRNSKSSLSITALLNSFITLGTAFMESTQCHFSCARWYPVSTCCFFTPCPHPTFRPLTPFIQTLVAMLRQQTLGPAVNHCRNLDAVSGHNGCLSFQACKRADGRGREGRQGVTTRATTAARVE